MLLYIHVPFCRSKCRYCAFHSLPLGNADDARMTQYVATLVQEITLWAERLGPCPVESVFFGGGTPSLLPARAVHTILTHINRHFSLAARAEITMEANPESALLAGWLGEVHAMGVNRISLGVQSFDDAFLRILGRPHDAATAIAAWKAIQKTQFTSASLDLMWGLPGTHEGQTLAHWHNTLKTAAQLDPPHCSCYCLTLEQGSSLARACDEKRLVLPDDDALAAQFLHTHSFLQAHGLAPYEIANFSAPGHQCRHNAGYWAHAEYLGVGPAATSMLYDATRKGYEHVEAPYKNAVRWTNPCDHDAWAQEVAQQSTGTAKTPEYEHLPHAVRMQEFLMLGLRTVHGLDLMQWEQQQGVPFDTIFQEFAAQLEAAGLAQRAENRFFLSTQGLLRANTIIEHMFSLLLCAQEP